MQKTLQATANKIHKIKVVYNPRSFSFKPRLKQQKEDVSTYFSDR